MSNINISQEDKEFLKHFWEKITDGLSTGAEVSLDKLGSNIAKVPTGDWKYFGNLFKKYSYFGAMLAIKESLNTDSLAPFSKYLMGLVLTFICIPSTWGIIPTALLSIFLGEMANITWDYIEENKDNLLEALKQLLADKGIEIKDDGSIQCELPTYINICPLPKEPICKIKDLFGTAEEVRSPLVVDLDGDGVETVTAEGGVYFDHDANGFKENSGWVGQDDGILVRDINGNGIIDNGTELFGNNSVLSSGEKAVNGFEALKDLDDNNDGIFDRNDKAWNEVKIWQDKNFNGNYSIVKSANPVFS